MTDYLDLFRERLAFIWYRGRHLRDGSWRHAARDAKQVILATKQYIRSDLFKRLEIPRGTPVTIELPSKGLTNMLWLASFGERHVMVNCYLVNEWPRMEQQLTALKLMNESGVRSPAVLDTVRKARRHGVYFVATEFVQGVSRAGKEQKFSTDELTCVARQLARLHSTTNRAWGGVCLPRNSNYFARQMRLVRRYADTAARAGILSAGQKAKLLQWFESWRPRLDEIREYSLVHGDVHPNNILFDPDGNCCLLDTDRVAWNLPMPDIAAAHDRVCRWEEGAIASFDEAYLGQLSPEMAGRHSALWPLFVTLYRLRIVTRELDGKVDPGTMPHKEQWGRVLQTCCGG